jgi:hypothetical protein
VQLASYWARDRRQLFYLLVALVGLGAVLVGFSTTYIAPMARRSFHAPAVVHIHGAFALTWILLFGVQALLVRQGATKVHMRLGIIALPVAFGIVVSGTLVGRWTVTRDLPSAGPIAFASLAGTFTSLCLFAGLVIWALLLRRRSDWHKRLLLLATVVVWWPAWFRWRHLFPGVPRPDLVFGLAIADLPILIAGIRDRIRYGAVHPVWLFVGPAVFLEQLFETLNFAAGGWPELGKWLYEISG